MLSDLILCWNIKGELYFFLKIVKCKLEKWFIFNLFFYGIGWGYKDKVLKC